MNKSILITGFVILVLLGGAGYYAMTQQNTAVNNVPVEEMTVSPTIAPTNMETISPSPSKDSAQEIKEIKIEAGSFYYKPNMITVRRGERIKIVMNAVSLMHDFNIDELNVKMPIVQNGETGSVEFIAGKVGTFEYYCSVGQHRANGQVGKITVEE